MEDYIKWSDGMNFGSNGRSNRETEILDWD